MGPAAVPIAIALFSAAVSASQSRAAGRSAAKARRAQRRAEKIRAARARQQQLSEARRRRASVINAEGVAGVSTSATEGAVSSIQSQLASNVSFLNQIDTLSETSFLALNRAASAQQNANTASAVSSVAGSFVGGGAGLPSGGGGTDIFTTQQNF